MSDAAYVYMDIEGAAQLVGRLWAHSRRGRGGAVFEYDGSWLRHSSRFALEPALMLGPGKFHTSAGKGLFGAIGDSAPDRWGRMLMGRVERQSARADGRPPRTLGEIDYLLLVDDEARQGALRFSLEPEGPFLAEHQVSCIPPLIELPRLLSACENIEDEDGSDEDLKILFAPGSSLGGARPKASVRDSNRGLAIAKFPRQTDDHDTVRWEAVALSLARRAGIAVPEWRIEIAAGKPVLILQRFDRQRISRIPFLSAMSMIGAQDNETHSYLELVDSLRAHGATPKADIHELWRRIVFTVLISNTDDHMRNHGFLYTGPDGWVLSPAYDMNPVPTDIAPRILSSAIDLDDQTASLDNALAVAELLSFAIR